MLRSINARRRIGLLASSSLVASSLAAGLGGVALTAFTPAVALAACSNAFFTTAGLVNCGGVDTGVSMAASGGLTVIFQGETVTTNGVTLLNTGANNVTLGVNTTTVTGGPITNTGGTGVFITGGSGGNVEVDTGSVSAGSFPGVVITGSTNGIQATTGGGGTVLINARNNVTGTTGTGIIAQSGSGSITINAETNTGAGVTVAGGVSGISASTAGSNVITINAPGTTTSGGLGGAAISATSTAGGSVVINSGVATDTNAGGIGGNGILVSTAGGSVDITTTGATTGTSGTGGGFFGIYAVSNGGLPGGHLNITTGGVVANGISAGGTSPFPVNLNINGAVTNQGITVGDGFGGQGGGSAVVNVNSGNVSNTVVAAGIGINELGDVSLTTAAGVDVTSTTNGVVAQSLFGNVTINLQGTVGNGLNVGGDGVTALTALTGTNNSINVTTNGVFANGNGIVAHNGGSGATTVNANTFVEAVNGAGITATTFSLGGGSGADTVNLANGLIVTAGTTGVSMTSNGSVGDVALNIGHNTLVTAGLNGPGDGVTLTSFGSGNITVAQTTVGDHAAAILSQGGNGITADEALSATGAINITFDGNIGSTATPVLNAGIVAQILNAANASGITIEAGNVSANNGAGIFAQTAGAGNINITTIAGTNVSSLHSDGIDAFALGGGNVVVNLLDGTVSAASSGVGGPPGSGTIVGSGPSAPFKGTGGAQPLDPNGVHMTAVGAGTVTINQNSDVKNGAGPGSGIIGTTVDGNATFNINANVSNTGGNAIEADSTGSGSVAINLFKEGTGLIGQSQATSITVTTTGGSGILAENTNFFSVGTSAIIDAAAGASGNLTVQVTGGLVNSAGIEAFVNGFPPGELAKVDLSNMGSGGNVSVEGAGSNVGIEAVAAFSPGGTAEVTTNNGLGVSVGTLGGSNDVGIQAVVSDTIGGQHASVTLGNTNTVTVGAAGGVGSNLVGVQALAGGPNAASVTAGDKLVVNVGGTGGVGVGLTGVRANSGVGTASITIGNGGSITVNDTAGALNGVDAGVTASTAGAGNVSISIGTTSVSDNNGVGIVGSAVGGTVTVSSNGNVNASGVDIEAFSATGNTTINVNTPPATGSVVHTFGGAYGEIAMTGGSASAIVNLGNGVGTTTITGTNTSVVSVGVEADATGSGNAIITSNGGVTVDPTEFGMEAQSATGQAAIATGANDSYTVSDPAFVAPEHIGLYAHSGAVTDPGAGPSALVTIDQNNTITVGGPGAGMPLEDGAIGVAAVNLGNGVGSAVVATSNSGNGLSISVGGANSAGIAATTNGFNGLSGFDAATGSGNVTVNTGTGLITVGADAVTPDIRNNFSHAYGIYTSTNGGNINVANNASITVDNGLGQSGAGGNDDGTVGIFATTNTKGNIDIGAPTAGSLIQTQYGDGILAVHTGGGSGSVTVGGGANGVINASITTGTNIAVGPTPGSGNGIEATTNGSGTVSVNQGAPSTITTLGTSTGPLGTANVGILAVGSGTVTVGSAGTITTAQGGGNVNFGSATVNLAGQGIVATTASSGAVTVNQSGTITTAGASDGIDATNSGSFTNASVTVNASGTINSGADAIVAENAGSGVATVNLNGAHVTAAGSIGVFAFTLGSGTASVIMSGAGSSVLGNGAFAVAAQSDFGSAEVETAGTVTAPTGVAVGTFAFGGSALTIVGAGSTVEGAGGPSTPTIETESPFSNEVDNNGTVTTENAALTNDGGLAIEALDSGTVLLNNNNGGKIFGRLNFGSATGSVTINNNAGALWESSGSSTIGATNNVETITNAGTIITAPNGAFTALNFGSGANTLNNAAGGIIVAGQAPIPGAIVSDPGSLPGGAAAPAVTLITGTLTFTNNGVIVLGGTTAGSDRKIDSVLVATGAAFGGTTGLIDLDANLWNDVQTAANCSSFSLRAADCLIVGSTSGNNGIRVKDTNAHAFGAFNPTGITIVVGSSAAGTFHLDAGSDFFDPNPADAFLFGGHTKVLNKPGLFFYDLSFFSSDHTERLIGVPKATAFEFASVGGAATDLWYTTTQTWFDRTTDLRDTIQGRSNGSEPAVWLKLVGDWSHRNGAAAFTDGSETFVFNTSFDRDTAGLIGGVDLLNVTDKDQAWVVGVESGYADSDMRFATSPDRFDFQTTDFGGYATYLSHGLFVDGTINANFFRLNGNLPSLGGTPPAFFVPVTTKTRGTTVGGQVEAGYNMPLGAMWFWEPVGSLAYVSSSFDNIPIPGGTVHLGGNDHSFRGSLGARIGVTDDMQFYKIKLAITARVWDEFSDDTLSTLIVPGGPDFTNADNLKGAFGEVSGQANLFSTKSGFSAWATGGYKFKSNYNEGTVTVGIRQQW